MYTAQSYQNQRELGACQHGSGAVGVAVSIAVTPCWPAGPRAVTLALITHDSIEGWRVPHKEAGAPKYQLISQSTSRQESTAMQSPRLPAWGRPGPSLSPRPPHM